MGRAFRPEGHEFCILESNSPTGTTSIEDTAQRDWLAGDRPRYRRR
jgi:hypothetical protein